MGNFLSLERPDCFWQFKARGAIFIIELRQLIARWHGLAKMIAEDISKGKENVKVPVVNELNDEKPNEFVVIIAPTRLHTAY